MKALINPLGALWLFMVFGLLVQLWRRRWRSAAGTGLIVGLFFLLGNTPLIDSLVAAAEKPYAEQKLKQLPAADAVVALGGGGLLAWNNPLGFSLGPAGDRYLTGVWLTRLGKAPVLVLGGSVPIASLPGVLQMKPVQDWIQDWRLTPSAVTNLGFCADTHEEAIKYAEMAGRHKWTCTLLVTSALHLPRALAVFRHQGLTVIPVGSDFQAYGNSPTWSLFPLQRRFELWSLYLHEQIGWWVYRWRGWI